MRMSLPSVIRGSGATLFDTETPALGGDLVMFLYIDFTIKNRDIRGFIALLMDLPSIIALKKIVRDFIGRLDEQSGHVE
jgi:chemotaxis protein CheC